MISAKLTQGIPSAHNPPMTGEKRARAAVAMAMLGQGVIALTLAGCISLETPDQPIVIELNINITQEVIYRLAEDAGNTIDQNAEIF